MLIAWLASLLRSGLQGRQPCHRWFAVFAGTIAAETVIVVNGVYRFGNAEFDWSETIAGLFGGLVWSGVFSFFSSRAFWIAFDSSHGDYSAEERRSTEDFAEISKNPTGSQAVR